MHGFFLDGQGDRGHETWKELQSKQSLRLFLGDNEAFLYFLAPKFLLPSSNPEMLCDLLDKIINVDMWLINGLIIVNTWLLLTTWIIQSSLLFQLFDPRRYTNVNSQLCCATE